MESRFFARDTGWACYHADLYRFTYDEIHFGIIDCVVSASFAVLVAKEFFASGAELVINVSSVGQITRVADPPYFAFIERALYDEGTSDHYLPPSDFSYILRSMLERPFSQARVPVYYGATWTADDPFRETENAIDYCRDLGVIAIEMEATALYTLAKLNVHCLPSLRYQPNGSV